MKHIEDRDASYLGRKKIIVEDVIYNQNNEISEIYGYKCVMDGEVYEEGTPINKETLKFIRKGYRINKKTINISTQGNMVDTIYIDCLEKVSVTLDIIPTNLFSLQATFNEDTYVVKVLAIYNIIDSTQQGTENIPFQIILTSQETGVTIGVIDCYVKYTYASISPED